jgi:outer membrane protein OmpA-like peptidoglycan-associated protein
VLKSTIASGNLTRLVYESPKERSPLEVFTNYEQALKGAGFEILFECKDKECGPSYASSRWARVNGMRIVSSPMWYLAAKKRSEDMEAYVAISVVKGGHQIDVLEAREMEKGKVKVSIESLRKELVAEGKAVLEGVYFETDKAVLEPESKPALAVIAELLQADPAMKVYIVGHTDTDGDLQHNMTLSRARAQAVVDALTKEHGILLHRLEAHGVGPLSPAKSNRGADGKAGNRRVEMVER